MSRRRNTTNRMTLFRVCGTCGKRFTTTADTPWIRQVQRDGKKQATTYYCSGSCFAASYKYKSCFDGKADERRREREAKRDRTQKNRRYYLAHREQELERARKRREADRAGAAADLSYQRRKRKLLSGA